MKTKKLSEEAKKNLKQLAQEIVIAIIACICLLFFDACGSTKVSVNRPNQGTYTTITVTTNNPISTEVNPETNTNINPFK